MSEFIRKEIKELAETILEQTNKLLAYPQGAPQIEVDIIKENIRKLYDQMDSLVNSQWQNNAEHIEKSLEEKIDQQVEELLDKAAAHFDENQDHLTPQLEDQHNAIEEQNEVEEEEIEVLNEAEQIVKEKEIAEINFEKAQAVEQKKEEKTKADPVVEKAAPKIIAETETANLGDKLQKKPISSLKSAIGINDKFQFINELFDGSMKVYNQTIDQLEQSSGKEEAFQVFDDIAKKRQWDEENPVYAQLFDYVTRRFIS